MKKNQTCAVRDCDSTELKDPDLKFYPIPKEDHVKKKWLKAINRSEEELTKRSKVCSKHFKNTDYTVTRFNYTMGNKNEAGNDKSVCEWKVLKTEVVPSLSLPEKSTFKIKISKKDNSKEVKVEEVKVKEEKDKDKPTRMPKRPAPPLVEAPKEPPGRSRRQASKEALKQMQLLLDDENDAVEIASDEDFSYLDIIPVEPTPPPPPKKKYKLSHRKSSDGNVDREVLVLKSITNRNAENTLELDCWVEPLDEIQKARYKKYQDEEKEIQKKLDSLIHQGNANVIHKGDLSTIIEISEYVQSAIQAAQVPPNATPVVLNNAISTKQGYQLVMDSRLGLIAVSQSSTSTTSASTTQKVYANKVQVAQNLHTTSANNQTRMRTRRGRSSPTLQLPVVATPTVTTRSGLQTRSAGIPPPPSPKTATPTRTVIPTRTATPTRSVTPTRNQIVTRSTPVSNKAAAVVKNATLIKSAPPPTKKAVPVPTPPPPVTRTRQSSSASLSNPRPSEENVEGGLATGGGGTGGGHAKKIVVDLTTEDGKSMPDSKEIAFNKLQGKTFPSLVVVARPHLRVQDSNVDRPKLDSKVKSVLMHAPTKFTEWLIQQGLIRSEQRCSTHTTTQLKLGMYSDVSKFPYSGGYVWISECCPQRFVSVFSGSLFEGSVHPPMVILKLIYHWACQTNIQNVTQWVKVDNLYVKGMFTWLRAVTTSALHTHLRQLGGPSTRVEVGVISLGTTSQDGNQRQVKVEVLGVLESASKLVRLRAVEPQTDGDRNYKKRFSKILEPIQQWVHPESILVADLTVDKQTLHNMGFTNVLQASSSEYGNNRQVMEYLRRIVPRMFQNTLSLLSRQIIQQFLDELVWREWFGTTSLEAFDNLVQHLAEQTRYDSLTLITRLNRIAQNPFKDWALPASVTNANVVAPSPQTIAKTADSLGNQQNQNQKKQRHRKQELNTKPTQQLSAKSIQQVPSEMNRPPKSISPDVPEQMVPLEYYYYGTIENFTKSQSVKLNLKCPYCKSVFDNNIQLMSHLFKHAHNVSQDAQLCRYCLTSVPTANDLLKHIASSHPAETKFDNGFVCLICETQYMNPFILGKHMSKEHCPSELPYQCGTCGYRCSNHKQAIDHFYKMHDDGPTIQCPFCLKSTTVHTTSRTINQNVNYFIQHLQKHQRKQFARRCGKCNLWFVQKDVLRDHQTRMHISQRGKPRLVPWTAPRNGVMVPKSKMDKYPGDADVINFSMITLNVPTNLMCKECNTAMDTPKHFPSFESCQNPNCQYSTCCTNAMQEHNAKCSKTHNAIENEKLPFEMFCVCGYSDVDGNQMARHLAICERKSAYPSRTDAQAAIVTHSMLDVLGLVRKPDETKKDEADTTANLADDAKDSKTTDSNIDDEKMEVDEIKEKLKESTGEETVAILEGETSEKNTEEALNKVEEQTESDDKQEERPIEESDSETMEIATEDVTPDIENNTEAKKQESDDEKVAEEEPISHEKVEQDKVIEEDNAEIATEPKQSDSEGAKVSDQAVATETIESEEDTEKTEKPTEDNVREDDQPIEETVEKETKESGVLEEDDPIKDVDAEETKYSEKTTSEDGETKDDVDTKSDEIEETENIETAETETHENTGESSDLDDVESTTDTNDECKVAEVDETIEETAEKGTSENNDNINKDDTGHHHMESKIDEEPFENAPVKSPEDRMNVEETLNIENDDKEGQVEKSNVEPGEESDLKVVEPVLHHIENLLNHIKEGGDDDVTMETTEILQANKPDITNDDIDNLISDMVTESDVVSNSSETDNIAAGYSNCERDAKMDDDIVAVGKSTDVALSLTTVETLENEEDTPMETD